jgi:hypothetical protein
LREKQQILAGKIELLQEIREWKICVFMGGGVEKG